ncbi:MAG: tetratricopeptide repeat protein [Rhodomicrobium sp.]
MSLVLPSLPGKIEKRSINAVLKEALSYIHTNTPDRALACLSAYPNLVYDHAFACYLTGLIYVTMGQDEAALPYHERALELQPAYTEVLEGRARILLRANRLGEATEAFETLIRTVPASATALHGLGMALESAGRNVEALEWYGRCLETAPGFEPALRKRAELLHALDRKDEALAVYERLAAIEPSDPKIRYNWGALLASRGDAAAAYIHFKEALDRDPGYGMALYGAATALQKLGRLEEAMGFCDKLLTQTPFDFDAWFLRGNIFYAQLRIVEALAAFDKALAVNPSHVGALSNRGAALRELGRLAEAAAMFDAALACNPRCVEALLGRGIVAFKSARVEEALEAFEAAVRADPSSATAFCGRGLALQELGRFGEALSDFEHSLSSEPKLAEGHSNLGALYLFLGDFERGWEGYEYRKLRGGVPKTAASELWPVWNGEEIAGKKLLVLNEAAYGDAFMLARYFSVLARMGVEVTFECNPRMIAVLRKVAGVRLITKVEADAHFDYQVHLFSLPRALRTRLETIPAKVPYIEPDAELTAKWAARLGSQGFKIGIAWQGNPNPKIDMARAAPLSAFAPLFQLPGVRFISLQVGFGADQIESAGLKVETLGPDFDSGPHAFLDTAAVMAHLDLVVCVDTSVAHLAGALGRPVFVALKHVPEWRWLLGRGDSPWYPTMRLFRQQTRGDWSGVFSAIAKAVQELLPGTHAVADEPLQISAAVGELFDKISILEIKSERIPDAGKLANVMRELTLLQNLKKRHGFFAARADTLAASLKQANLSLWNIEDTLRKCERAGDFGPAFVELARSVYKENDKRAELKREINQLFASAIIEEKYYPSGE